MGDPDISWRTLWSPRGRAVNVATREGTSDLSVMRSTFSEFSTPENDEYRLVEYEISGRALDVGAHIGTVTLAILADNPDAFVEAVEPLAANVSMIEMNLEANGWRDRAIIFHGAVGQTSVSWDYAGDDYNRTNRFVGGLSEQTPVAQQREDVPMIDISGEWDFVKFDCEGCEWHGGLEAVASSRVVVGEWHGDPGAAEIRRIFGRTHDLRLAPNGVNGLFWAIRR